MSAIMPGMQYREYKLVHSLEEVNEHMLIGWILRFANHYDSNWEYILERSRHMTKELYEQIKKKENLNA
jgi:hypothetical protein